MLLLCWWRRCGAGPVLCCWFGAWCCWGDSGGGAAGSDAGLMLGAGLGLQWIYSTQMTMPGREMPIIF